jgi:ABC-type transport system substrate-binding protein
MFGTFLTQKINKHPFTVVGDGKQTRDFTFVTDVVEAMIKAANYKKNLQIFNIGSGKSVSINKICELLGGKKIFIASRPGEPKITHADIEKAKKILDGAGFPQKDKYRFKISYKTTTDSTRINIARAIASQLKKIGIKVIIEPMEWGRFKQDVENGRVQMWSLSWIGFKDPDIFRYAFASESFPPNGGNRGRYHNKALDKLVGKGILTQAFSERKKIYDQVQQIINDELPYIFLWHEKNFAVVQKSIQGFELYQDGRLFSLIKTSKQ